MANQVSKILNFVISEFDKQPLVNTIAKYTDVIDVEKENIYPMVAFNITNQRTELDMLIVDMEFKIANQRDDNKRAKPSKLLTNTNYIDNIGIVGSIANNFKLDILKFHNPDDINIIEYSDDEFEENKERNGLDTVTFTAKFSIIQNEI